MVNLLKASVYVGTYGKYNAGSIEGKWLPLKNYASKQEFENACKELHKDEAEPEFMFQDYENIPDMYIEESYISDEVFDVINQIKKLSKAKQEQFYEWCDNEGREQDLQSLADFVKANPTKRVSEAKQRIEEYRQKLIDAGESEYWANLSCGNLYDVVKLSENEYVKIIKTQMETSFWIGYSDCGQGQSYAEANEQAIRASKNKDYFFNSNIYKFEKDNDVCALQVYIQNLGIRHKLYTVKPLDEQQSPNCWIKLTEEGREDLQRDRYFYKELTLDQARQILAVIETYEEKFKKRLENYYKRYSNKISVDTYWIDR